MSLVQIEKPREEKNQKHKRLMSDILIHATEKQCSGANHQIVNGKDEYCAMGLMFLYANGSPSSINYVAYNSFGIDISKQTKCPECGIMNRFDNIVAHLNNDNIDHDWLHVGQVHGWSFKQVGQWLQGLGY